jgi:hypothetical protein
LLQRARAHARATEERQVFGERRLGRSVVAVECAHEKSVRTKCCKSTDNKRRQLITNSHVTERKGGKPAYIDGGMSAGSDGSMGEGGA